MMEVVTTRGAEHPGQSVLQREVTKNTSDKSMTGDNGVEEKNGSRDHHERKRMGSKGPKKPQHHRHSHTQTRNHHHVIGDATNRTSGGKMKIHDQSSGVTDKKNPNASLPNDQPATVNAFAPPKDENLPPNVMKDPRGDDPTKRIVRSKNISTNKKNTGRNTESFDPKSTLVRPALRVKVGSGSQSSYTKPLKHDDVVIVPELFGEEDDYTLYYKLIQEMTDLQTKQNVKRSEWIPWHEGAHLISKDPSGSPTFNTIIDKLCDYFHIRKSSIGTRFNWYKDSSDWKPFHHDSAAFNAQRAKNQNITVGVSFGATRELAFLLATEGGKNDVSHNDSCRLYFPQPNNGVFSFGRDVNIRWKHGINALPEDEQDGKGRVSIILWGLCENVIDESGSPPMLGADGKGPHAQRHHHHQRGGKSYNNKNSSNDNRRTHHHNHQQQNKQNSNENNQRNGAGGGR